MRRLIILLPLFLTSCATTWQDTAAACDSYVSDEVATVFRFYDEYDQHGFAPGMVTEARQALEHARLALHHENALPGVPVCPRKHKRSAEWRDLSDDLEVADALVVELETARGLRFVAWTGTSAEWVDSTTGRPVPQAYADAL